MKRMLVDEIVESYENDGTIRTSRSGDDVLEVVLRSISGTVRFNATTIQRHTVLVHSWYVGILASELAPEGLKDMARLAGMMHDFGETVVGDFVMPVKSGRLFGDVYRTYYEPLEKAFRSFVGNNVIGIRDFDARYASVEEYVTEADSIIGEIELYGDTMDMDDETREHVNNLFKEMDDSVSNELFVGTLKELSEKIGN